MATIEARQTTAFAADSLSSGACVDELDVNYLRRLIEGIAEESHEAAYCVRRATWIARAARKLGRTMSGWKRPVSAALWSAAWHQYAALCECLTARRNSAAEIARTYQSMEEFWSDADRQQAGQSPYTFWDTYEHGRRRQLERDVAIAYGVETAVLMNSGMSALSVVFDCFAGRTGTVIVTGRSNYFETSEHLGYLAANRGVIVERVNLEDAYATARALERLRPNVVFFESISNTPSLEVPRGLESWAAAAPDAVFVCDNTVQGVLGRWLPAGQAGALLRKRLVVVESLTKYLSQKAMAGTAYGCADMLEKVRIQARSSGQLLQEKAFNYLRSGEIRNISTRMQLHARNVRVFAQRLMKVRNYFDIFGPVGSDAAMSDLLHESCAAGAGSLFFMSLKRCGSDGALVSKRHQRLLSEWRNEVQCRGEKLTIRAGFGWSDTTARLYEGQFLNQPDAPTYLRVSLGIEPLGRIRSLADALECAIERLI